jgi:hypothetical protein
MYGDIERSTFDPLRHYTRVLKQQGRVELPADSNEQTAILLHYLRALVVDLKGAGWGPKEEGFKISDPVGNPPTSFSIGRGRYYVDGLLAECDTEGCKYRSQPNYPLTDKDKLPEPFPYLLYLDLWEREVGYIEDAQVREIALGGPDTCTRAQLVWQVKTQKVNAGTTVPDIKKPDVWEDLRGLWQPIHRGFLRARVAPQEAATDPCTTSPKSSYRGAENQLYRVEVHRGGQSGQPGVAGPKSPPTFKWSRDNGSVCFPVLSLSGNAAMLAMLGRDDRHSLEVGDWVELVYDEAVLRGIPSTGTNAPTFLAQVANVELSSMTVTLTPRPASAELPAIPNPAASPEAGDRVSHPFLRRWDHRTPAKAALEHDVTGDGALPLREGQWLTLEDGIQIEFVAAKQVVGDNKAVNTYRSGDYWLIPARTATGDVEWPIVRDANGAPEMEDGNLKPAARRPDGVEHHYAPLSLVKDATNQDDIRTLG